MSGELRKLPREVAEYIYISSLSLNTLEEIFSPWGVQKMIIYRIRKNTSYGELKDKFGKYKKIRAL